MNKLLLLIVPVLIISCNTAPKISKPSNVPADTLFLASKLKQFAASHPDWGKLEVNNKISFLLVDSLKEWVKSPEFLKNMPLKYINYNSYNDSQTVVKFNNYYDEARQGSILNRTSFSIVSVVKKADIPKFKTNNIYTLTGDFVKLVDGRGFGYSQIDSSYSLGVIEFKIVDLNFIGKPEK